MTAHLRGAVLLATLCGSCVTSTGAVEGDVQAYATPLLPPNVCAIQAYDNHYLTAMDGGGRVSDVIHTNATRINNWEQFTLIDSGDGSSPTHYGIQTVYGYYLSAVGGGGRTTDVIHSNATQLLGWETFSIVEVGFDVYAIQTLDGHYLTAVDSGGRTTDTIHSDAPWVGSWETFRFRCDTPLTPIDCVFPDRDCGGGTCIPFDLPCP